MNLIRCRKYDRRSRFILKTFIVFILFTFFSAQFAAAVNTPEWYNGNRVHVHTRLNIRGDAYWTYPQFWEWPQELSRLGVSVSTRFIKGDELGAWWPSSVGAIHPRVDEIADTIPNGDIALKLIQDSHANGIKQFAYYRHQEDVWAQTNHPGWRSLARDGNPIWANESRGAYYMSLASPYSDYLITRITELAQRGVDGIYFDFIHIPPEGDFNTYSQALYAAWHGGADLLAATAEEVQIFRQEVISDFFSRLTAAFHAINPEGVILLSGNQCSLDTLRVVDAPKYEHNYNPFLGGLESTATILTDVGGGYPHIWRFDHDDSLATVARYLAFGTIYNRDIHETEIYNVPDTYPLPPDVNYADIFDLGRQVSPAMSDVEPFRYARVLLPGDIVVRAEYLGTEYLDAWNTLIESRIPAGYLGHSQMLAGEVPLGTEVLVIPDYRRDPYTAEDIGDVPFDIEIAPGPAPWENLGQTASIPIPGSTEFISIAGFRLPNGGSQAPDDISHVVWGMGVTNNAKFQPTLNTNGTSSEWLSFTLPNINWYFVDATLVQVDAGSNELRIALEIPDGGGGVDQVDIVDDQAGDTFDINDTFDIDISPTFINDPARNGLVPFMSYDNSGNPSLRIGTLPYQTQTLYVAAITAAKIPDPDEIDSLLELINMPSDLRVAVDAFESAGGLVIYQDEISDMIATINNRGPIPVTSTGGDSSTGMITFANPDKLVVNFAAVNQNDLVVSLSDQFYNEPVSVTESVTGQALFPALSSGGWDIVLPDVSVMAQVVINFTASNDLTISGTPATAVDEDAFYTFTPAVSGVDGGETITFSIGNQPPWASFDTNTGELSGTPDNADVGTYSGIVITVTDSSLDSASLPAFGITVNNVNDPPTISGTPAASVNQDTLYTFTPTASDIDAGDSLTFSIANQPAWAGFNPTTGELSGTPGNDDVGTYADIVTTVTDSSLATDSLPAFNISVDNVNDPPQISAQGFGVSEDAANGASVGTVSAGDADGDALSYAITAGNGSGVFAIDSVTGALTVADNSSLDFETTPSYALTVEVSDPGALSADATMTVTVGDANDAPTISGIPSTSVDEDTLYTFTPAASDSDAGDILTFSIVNQPGWASFDPNTGELSGTPSNADVGTYSDIKITVTDSSNESASLPAFDLTVVSAGGGSEPICGDLNGDGQVSGADRSILFAALRACEGDARYNPDADLDGDGCVTFVDYSEWYRCYKAFLE